MGENHLGKVLAGLSPHMKKEILQGLVASLLEGLHEEEKKDILQAVLTRRSKDRELIDMVGQ